VDHAREAHVRRDGEAEDLALLLGNERLGRRSVGHLPGALHVQLDHGAKALRADRLGRAHELSAGVVDQQVEPAVPLHHPIEERVDPLLVADVERLRLGLPSRLRHLGDHLLERLGAAPAADHGGAEAGELERGRLAEAGPGP
jgi:hypothetical protein